MKFTLYQILNEFKIKVPIIQRDYAQGRKSESELRDSFITNLRDVLKSESSNINLDFVYGYAVKESVDTKVFVPLDGQQRLTTLWLIHWYFASKEGKLTEENLGDEESILIRNLLQRFTYETRISSTRFCEKLVSHPISIIRDNSSFSKEIKDAPWFMPSWENDPTVVSMLIMLDTIDKIMFDCEDVWNQLTAQRKITFDYIDIKSEEFKLTDELYIKMNSRGKPLTKFEDFKAQFSGLLASTNTDYVNATLTYNNHPISFQQYFAFKIDSVWMDFFWSYRDRTRIEIDKYILNFIYYIAEILYYKENVVEESFVLIRNFNFLSQIFSKKSNVSFLFNSLDKLSGLDDLDNYFGNIYTNDKSSNGINLFDDGSANLFLRAITDTNFDNSIKITFYSFLIYIINTDLGVTNVKLKCFLRIIRNLLISTRQINTRSRIDFTSNLRWSSLNEYSRFIDAFVDVIKENDGENIYKLLAEGDFNGFTAIAINQEKAKAEILASNESLLTVFHRQEDHPELLGNISNFKIESSRITDDFESFSEIWHKDTANSLIVRALLTINDYSINTHDETLLGGVWYFGAFNSWNRILTTTNGEEKVIVAEILENFLISYRNSEGYDANKKLQYLIDSYKPKIKDWRYYFVKYPPIIDNRHSNLNVFTWPDGQGFNISSVGNSGKRPLSSYHFNPYLLTVEKEIADLEKAKLVWARFADVSYLQVRNLFNVFSVDDGWKLIPIEGFNFQPEISHEFNIQQSGDQYILKVSDKEDRIEVATRFISNY